MRIELVLNGTDYAIDLDDHNFTAVKKVITSVGKPMENILGYYNKLGNAANRCVREELCTSHERVTMKEFSNRVATLNKELIDQLNAIPV